MACWPSWWHGPQGARRRAPSRSTAIAGPKGRHDESRGAVRHGSDDGLVTLGGRQVPIRRPRLRSAAGQSEVALPSLVDRAPGARGHGQDARQAVCPPLRRAARASPSHRCVAMPSSLAGRSGEGQDEIVLRAAPSVLGSPSRSVHLIEPGPQLSVQGQRVIGDRPCPALSDRKTALPSTALFQSQYQEAWPQLQFPTSDELQRRQDHIQ